MFSRRPLGGRRKCFGSKALCRFYVPFGDQTEAAKVDVTDAPVGATSSELLAS
jgi:hypothetical protein